MRAIGGAPSLLLLLAWAVGMALWSLGQGNTAVVAPTCRYSGYPPYGAAPYDAPCPAPTPQAVAWLGMLGH